MKKKKKILVIKDEFVGVKKLPPAPEEWDNKVIDMIVDITYDNLDVANNKSSNA